MSTFGSHVGRMGAEPAGLGARGTLRRVQALWAYNWPYRRRSAVAHRRNDWLMRWHVISSLWSSALPW